MTTPLVGWYGDDFTGATDTLAVLAQAGDFVPDRNAVIKPLRT